MSLIIIKPKGVEYSKEQFVVILKAFKTYNDGASFAYLNNDNRISIFKMSASSDVADMASIFTDQLRILKRQCGGSLKSKEIICYFRRTTDIHSRQGVFNICPIGISEKTSEIMLANETVDKFPLFYFIGKIDMDSVQTGFSDIRQYIASIRDDSRKHNLAAANPLEFITGLTLDPRVSTRSKMVIFNPLMSNTGDSHLFYRNMDFTSHIPSGLVMSNITVLSNNVDEWTFSDMSGEPNSVTVNKQNNNSSKNTNVIVYKTKRYNIKNIQKGFSTKLLDLKEDYEDNDKPSVKKDNKEPETNKDDTKVMQNSNSVYRIANRRFNLIHLFDSYKPSIAYLYFEVRGDVENSNYLKNGVKFSITDYCTDKNDKGVDVVKINIESKAGQGRINLKLTKDDFRALVHTHCSFFIKTEYINKLYSYLLLHTLKKEGLMSRAVLRSLVQSYSQRMADILAGKTDNSKLKIAGLGKLMSIDNKMKNKQNKYVTIDGIDLFIKVYKKDINEFKSIHDLHPIFVDKKGKACIMSLKHISTVEN